MTAAQLAEELEVSQRTILRDIDALGVAGIPVYSTRGPAGGFEIMAGFRSRLSAVGTDEAIASTLLGVPLAAQVLGYGEPLLRLRLKLLQALPADQAVEIEAAAQQFLFDPHPWGRPSPERCLTFLATSIRRRREVSTHVHSRAARMIIAPLALVSKAGSWWLVAAPTGDTEAPVDPSQGLTVLAVDALAGYESTGRRFVRPGAFDLAAFWHQHAEKQPEPTGIG
jgi:predicted DNA-binding transcriptional regulator YafY